MSERVEKGVKVKRPRRWVSVLLAAAIFAGGFVCGGGAAVVLVVAGIQRGIHEPERVPNQLARRVRRKLDLTEAQYEKVRAILVRRHEALVAIRQEVRPRVDVELDGIRDEVAAVLTPAQKAEWLELVRTFRSRWMPVVPGPEGPGSKERRPEPAR